MPNADKFEFVGQPGGPEITWGELTSYAIHELENYDHGEHSSNPPDLDGHPGREGLPNLFGQGDLFATADFIADHIL